MKLPLRATVTVATIGRPNNGSLEGGREGTGTGETAYIQGLWSTLARSRQAELARDRQSGENSAKAPKPELER